MNKEFKVGDLVQVRALYAESFASYSVHNGRIGVVVGMNTRTNFPYIVLVGVHKLNYKEAELTHV